MKTALLRRMKPVLTVLGTVCALVALGYWVSVLWNNREALLGIHWGTQTWLGVGLALGLYGAQLWLSVLIWRGILHLLDTVGGMIQLAGVFVLSLLGRYIPLNVMQYVGRVYLGSRIGLAPATTSLSVIIELMLLLGLAGVIAVTGVVFGSVDIHLGSYAGQWGWKLLALVVGCLLLVFALKPGLRLAGRLLPDTWRLPPRIRWSWPLAVGLVFGGLGVFLILGAMLDLLAWGMLGLEVHRPFFLTWAFALAWTLGLITPGAPAGIGVREAVLLALLSIHYTEDQALALSLYSRLITVAGDGLYTLLYCGLFRRQCRILLGKRTPPEAR